MTVFASAAPKELDARAVLAHRIATSLTVGAAMLALALTVVVALIRRPRTVDAVPDIAVVAPLHVEDDEWSRGLEEVLGREIALT